MNNARLTKTIIVLAVVGLAISIYSWLHNAGFTSGEFCTISDTLSCDVVNKGPYSVIAGVPVALIGVIGYAFLLIGAVLKFRAPEDRQLSLFLLIASIGGLLFSLYLTGIEAFVLRVWCPLCLASQGVIILITFAIVDIFNLERNTKR